MAAWKILGTDPDDQPPEHDPDRPWVVLHPVGPAGRQRRTSRFQSHAAAAAFVLADFEARWHAQTRRHPDAQDAPGS